MAIAPVATLSEWRQLTVVPQRGQNLAVSGTALAHLGQRISSPGDGNSWPHSWQKRDAPSLRALDRALSAQEVLYLMGK